MDVQVVFSTECATQGSSVRLYTIKNDGVGYVIFADHTIEKNKIVGLYYGTLVYTELSSNLQEKNVYGDEHIGVKVTSL